MATTLKSATIVVAVAGGLIIALFTLQAVDVALGTREVAARRVSADAHRRHNVSTGHRESTCVVNVPTVDGRRLGALSYALYDRLAKAPRGKELDIEITALGRRIGAAWLDGERIPVTGFRPQSLLAVVGIGLVTGIIFFVERARRNGRGPGVRWMPVAGAGVAAAGLSSARWWTGRQR